LKVHGLLLLDKPVGLSSNVALQKVRRLLGADKAGHGGTLDPMASGAVPLRVGGDEVLRTGGAFDCGGILRQQVVGALGGLEGDGDDVVTGTDDHR